MFSNSDSIIHNMAMVLQQMMGLIYAILTILLKYMKKAEIFTVSLKNAKVKTIGYSAHVKIPVVYSRGKNIQPMDDILKYEMCAYPPSLFEAPQILKKPDKAELANANFWNKKKDYCGRGE